MKLRHSYLLRNKVSLTDVKGQTSKPVKPQKGRRTAKIMPEAQESTILDLPMDIMHEVHYDFFDLFQESTAYSNQRFLRICGLSTYYIWQEHARRSERLTSRTSVSIWKAARKHYLSMVDPPDDISEPLYAHLAFDSTCDICESASNVSIYWLDRLSICFHCRENFYGTMAKYEAVLPRSIIELLSLSSTVSPYIKYANYSKRLSSNWEEQYKKLSNQSEKDAWTLKTQNWVSIVETHTTQFNQWLCKKQCYTDDMFEELEYRLFSNLKTCGFGEELETLDVKWKNRLIGLVDDGDPNDLDRAWAVLKSPATSLLENARAERLLKNNLLTFGSVFKSHDFQFTKRTGFPDHIEISTVGPLRNILHTPLPLTEDTFFGLSTRKDLHDALKNWEVATSIRVLRLMQDGLRDPNIKLQDLHLPTIVFSCNLCLRLLSYPEACVHPCAFDPDELDRFHTLCGLVDAGKGATSWNVTRQIRCRTQDQRAAFVMLKMIDSTMDYSVATRDEKVIFVQCAACRRNFRKVRIEKSLNISCFSWRDAISHAYQVHDVSLPSQISWEIPGSESQALLQAELDKL